MSTATTPRKTRTARRWLRRAAGVIVAIVGLGAALTAYNHRQEQRAWRAACAEADRLDRGWRWDDLAAARPPLPDERNSVVRIRAAAKVAPELTQFRGPGYGEYARLLPQHRPSPRLVAELREFVTAAGPALADALALADYPEGRVPLPTSPVILNNGVDPSNPVKPVKGANDFDLLKLVRGLLWVQLILQAEEGDADGALRTVQAIVYMTRPLADSPRLLDALIAVAIRIIAAGRVERVLAQGEPSAAALDAARRLMEQEAARPLLLAAFRGERATLEDTLRAFDDGRLSRDDIAKVSPGRPWTGWPKVDSWINRLVADEFRRSNVTAQLRYLNWAIERLKESPDGLREHAAEEAALRESLPRTAKGAMDNLMRYAAETAFNEAQFRCAVAALAAEQFRQANGRWPTTLDELVPKYLAAVPRDPIDLQPLRLTRRPDGIVIHAVGDDVKDDGNLPGVQNTVRNRSVRLWDVDRRRQPPKVAGGG